MGVRRTRPRGGGTCVVGRVMRVNGVEEMVTAELGSAWVCYLHAGWGDDATSHAHGTHSPRSLSDLGRADRHCADHPTTDLFRRGGLHLKARLPEVRELCRGVRGSPSLRCAGVVFSFVGFVAAENPAQIRVLVVCRGQCAMILGFKVLFALGRIYRGPARTVSCGFMRRGFPWAGRTGPSTVAVDPDRAAIVSRARGPALVTSVMMMSRLWRGARLAPRVARRAFSSSAEARPSALVVQQQDDGVVSMQLSSKPVNGLSLDVCREFTATLKDLEANSAVRGMVLGSAVKGIFSAGLDLRSLLITPEQTADDLATFWTAVQELWLTLYMSRLATVAAISGHCPAGGCLLALSCDARVMVEGSYRMGLNEVHLGLVAPPWLSTMLKDTVGRRQAEWMLQLGQLLSADEALHVGMIDEVVPLASLHGASNAKMMELLSIPDGARAMAKQQVRRDAAAALRDFQNEDLDEFMSLITDPSVQMSLVAYLQSLKKKA